MPNTEPAAAPINLFRLTCLIRSSKRTTNSPRANPAPAAGRFWSPKGLRYHAVTDRMRTKKARRKNRSYTGTPHAVDVKRMLHARAYRPLRATEYTTSLEGENAERAGTEITMPERWVRSGRRTIQKLN